VIADAADRGGDGPSTLAGHAAALDAAAGELRPGAAFAGLEPGEQDAVLTGLEQRGSPTFRWLLETTMEGFYGDPRHGGNHDGVSWQLIGFPGPTGGTGYASPYGWYDANEPNLPGYGPGGSTEPTRTTS
jgi:hypothetical protein